MKTLKTRDVPNGKLKLKRKENHPDAPGGGPVWYVDMPGRHNESSKYTTRGQAENVFNREYNKRSGSGGQNLPGGDLF